MAAKKDLSFLTNSTSSRLEATALERSKREAELQEMRRLRAEAACNGTGVNWDNGAAPITDLEEWRNAQKNAAEEERRKKMEAAEGLHGYRGKEVHGIKKKSRDSKVFKQWEGKGRENESGGEGDQDYDDEQQEESDGPAPDDMGRETEHSAKAGDDNQAQDDRDDHAGRDAEHSEAPAAEKEEELEENAAQEEEQPAVQEEEPPVPEPEEANPIPQAEEAAPTEESIPEPQPEVEEQLPPTPPTYCRTDVKFSFGLIVRSNHPTGNFANENLRDNETLRKCMLSTSKILIKEMPSPPEIIEGENVDYSSFPMAYYDPTLQPTVLSIEEDNKNNNTHGGLEKGNKRTLVKASFPVFLREDKDGATSKSLLRETKSTVFKALREAVSGGSFLR
ncbi:hypothetical protein HJC23_005903 [Cyclotella cryptica]|uniref:Uncharacterized protein n=1 Tax=Cyclotella cryptica TaxID=29204 RepID=A0ABD3QZ69_9STRA|eukprot:CCRYP_000444-RA/>CCRYP_000444-RA protein AED:0.00 eAED:0.00 QI:188/-1/1/1/-1/1/1/357/391